jgi:NDP-sugar pyrophosphorylase family protein
VGTSMRKAYRRIIGPSHCAPLRGVAAVILAAGRGQRLLPFTAVTPKPLLPVLNLPILLWTTASLQRAGLGDVCINLHHMPDAFCEAIRVCNEHGLRLRSVYEARPTGPLGGAISCRSALPDSDVCLILSGDALYDLDFGALLAAHRASRSDLTLTVTKVSDAWRYGVLDIDSRGFVTRMREKPREVQPVEYVSCGIYAISTQRLLRLHPPSSMPYDFIDLVSSMLAAGDAVATYSAGGWSDVGTPDDLRDVNLAYLASPHLAVIALHEWESPTGELWRDGTEPLPQACSIIGRALVGPRVTIDSGVTLSDSVIGSRATIRTGAKVIRSVILPGATVPAGAQVTNGVVGP